MVDCSDFLDRYSEFRDGLLEHDVETAFEAHLDSCSSCARYDRVIGQGVGVFRKLPELTPSYDFEARLQYRLFRLEDERAAARNGSGASLATTMGICAAIALAAWLPTVRPQHSPVRLPPVVAHAPHHYHVEPVIFRAGPIFTSRLQGAPEGYGDLAVFQRPAQSPTVAARPVAAFYLPVP